MNKKQKEIHQLYYKIQETLYEESRIKGLIPISNHFGIKPTPDGNIWYSLLAKYKIANTEGLSGGKLKYSPDIDKLVDQIENMIMPFGGMKKEEDGFTWELSWELLTIPINSSKLSEGWMVQFDIDTTFYGVK